MQAIGTKVSSTPECRPCEGEGGVVHATDSIIKHEEYEIKGDTIRIQSEESLSLSEKAKGGLRSGRGFQLPPYLQCRKGFCVLNIWFCSVDPSPLHNFEGEIVIEYHQNI